VPPGSLPHPNTDGQSVYPFYYMSDANFNVVAVTASDGTCFFIRGRPVRPFAC